MLLVCVENFPGVGTTPAVCVMLTLKRGVFECAVQSFTTLFSLQVARNKRQIQRGHDVGGEAVRGQTTVGTLRQRWERASVAHTPSSAVLACTQFRVTTHTLHHHQVMCAPPWSHSSDTLHVPLVQCRSCTSNTHTRAHC